MRKPHILALAALGALAACADDPTRLAAPELPSATTLISNCTRGNALDTAGVPITSYASYVANGDWGPAIQRAVDDHSVVRVPSRATPYLVKTPVRLWCGTRLKGNGATGSVLEFAPAGGQSAAYGPYPTLLVARGTAASPARNITVERLGFRAGASDLDRIAFRVFTGKNVTFRLNRAENMTLIDVTAHYDTLDFHPGNRDVTYTHAVALNDTAALSAEVTVYGNEGAGNRLGGLAAINLGYARAATVDSNTVRNYATGVQWWGGGITVGKSSNPYPKLSYGHLIKRNKIYDVTVGGVWGAMGRNIRVEGNRVERTLDVALDAEGSDSVTFYNNEAYNARNALMAVFWLSKGVVFDANRVYTDHADYANGQGFSTSTYYGSTVTVKNNTITYSLSTGFGRVSKSESEKLWFHSNTLRNVVIDFSGAYRDDSNGTWQSLNMGAVSVVGNTLTADRQYAARADLFWGGSVPAIVVANNHAPGGGLPPTINGSYHVEVSGNRVSSTWRQDGYGIHVQQRTGNTLQVTLDGNRVQDWVGASIVLERLAGAADHRYSLTSNQLSAGILEKGTITNDVRSNNTVIGNTYTSPPPDDGDPPGDCPDPTQVICDP